MKNMKISMKLSIMLSIVLVIGLGFICIMTNNNMKTSMRHTTYTRMEETAEARSKIVENYVASAEEFLRAYSQGSEVTEALLDPSEEKIAKLQEYTIRYSQVNKNLENIYTADDESLLLASVVDVLIGKNLREGEKLKELTDQTIFE